MYNRPTGCINQQQVQGSQSNTNKSKDTSIALF